MYQVKFKVFVVKMDDKEYCFDGIFYVGVYNYCFDDIVDVVYKWQFLLVEVIVIGFCVVVCLLGIVVFVWKFYVSENNFIDCW